MANIHIAIAAELSIIYQYFAIYVLMFVPHVYSLVSIYC